MGLIVIDNASVLNTGLVLSSLYYSIGSNTIYTSRFYDNDLKINLFKYHCSFNVYISKEARDKNLSPLTQIHVEDNSQKNEDAYEFLYKKLKTNFENYVDA